MIVFSDPIDAHHRKWKKRDRPYPLLLDLTEHDRGLLIPILKAMLPLHDIGGRWFACLGAEGRKNAAHDFLKDIGYQFYPVGDGVIGIPFANLPIGAMVGNYEIGEGGILADVKSEGVGTGQFGSGTTRPSGDQWDHVRGMCCQTCMFFSPKKQQPGEAGPALGRCRRHAPSMQGYPVVYAFADWCGDHKVGTNPHKEAAR